MDSVFILTNLGVFLQNLRPYLFLTVGSRSDGQYFRSRRGPSLWPGARRAFSKERPVLEHIYSINKPHVLAIFALSHMHFMNLFFFE